MARVEEKAGPDPASMPSYQQVWQLAEVLAPQDVPRHPGTVELVNRWLGRRIPGFEPLTGEHPNLEAIWAHVDQGLRRLLENRDETDSAERLVAPWGPVAACLQAGFTTHHRKLMPETVQIISRLRDRDLRVSGALGQEITGLPKLHFSSEVMRFRDQALDALCRQEAWREQLNTLLHSAEVLSVG